MKNIGELTVMDYAKDVTGQKYGSLTAVKPISKGGKKRSVVWLWQCDCGKQVQRTIDGVTRRIKIKDNTPSCGCARVYKLKAMATKGEGESAFNILFGAYKQKARERQLEFRLTKEEFQDLTKKDCYYCGKHPSQVFTRRRMYGSYTYNGVDRLNNSVGYTVENCVSCCKDCNWLKGAIDVDDFLDLVNRIVRHRTENASRIEPSL
jgi:hypothetical protein